MDATNPEIVEIALMSLADITDDDGDTDSAIPERLLVALEQAVPGTVVSMQMGSDTALRQVDRQHALIPKTKIVVKTTPLVWNLLKAVLKLLAALELHRSGQSVGAVLATGSAVESIAKARGCAESLDADAGEYCTYLTVVGSVAPLTRGIGMYPTMDQAKQAHLLYQATCDRASCQFHNGKRCHLTSSERDGVIEKLRKNGVLIMKPGDCIWVNL